MIKTSRQRNLPQIQPFWQRIPRFFAYGLHSRTLLLAGGLALLNALLLKGLFVIVLYAVTIRYAMAVLERTAAGELTPPPLQWQSLVEGYELPLKLFAILLIYAFMLNGVGNSLGRFPAISLYLLGSLLFPALIMMLVLSQSLLTALNPLGWIGLARDIGWPYLALFGLWLSVSSAQETASAMMLEALPRDWLLPFWLAINTVFSVIGFHMMGYVLLQYHREIGDPLAAGAQLAEQNPVHSLRSPLLDQLLADGRIEAAAAEIMDQVRQQPDNLELRRQAHNFLLSHDQDKLLLENANGLMDQLLVGGKFAAAAELFSDCRKRQLNCQPGSPLHYLALVRQLRGMGRARDAVKLSKGFHKRFPDSDDTPALYLEVAAAFSEDLQRDDLAQQLLDFLIRYYPQHERTEEARRYRDILTRLGNHPV